MSLPLVSVCMIVYNGEEFLREAIDGILNQTYQNLELVLVNDGSKDRTLNIIEEYASKDERVKYTSNEKNSGLTFTRNVALEMATGDYIAINDADDISDPKRLEAQVKYLEAHDDVVVCGTCARRFFPNGKDESWYFPITDREARVWMLKGVPNLNSSVMMRASVLRDAALKYEYGYASAEDFKLFARLSQKGKLVNLPDEWVAYRMHDAQQTLLQKKDMIRDAAKISIELMEDLGMELSESEKETFIKAFAFKYPFTLGELDSLRGLYEKLLASNAGWRFFHQETLRVFLSEKFFEACFHSTGRAGMNSFKNYYQASFSEPGDRKPAERVKFIVKSLLSR